MPVPEPADADLWPAVRALTGWPDSNEDTLRSLSAGWRGGGEQFTRAGGYDLAPLADGWPDAAGQALGAQATDQLTVAAETGTRMAELAQRADSYAAEVTGVKAGINALIAANTSRYATIAQLAPAAQPAARETFVREVAGMVDTMMREAASRIAAAGPVAVPVRFAAEAGARFAGPAAPPAGASPQEVRDWWDGLGPAGQEAVLRDDPDSIRNLDGIPATVRHQANFPVLQREIEDLRRREQELLLLQEDGQIRVAPGRRAELGEIRSELSEVRDRLTGLQDLQGRIYNSTPDEPTLLLGFDPAGDGRAIVAVGNPDTAGDVATLVPGIFNDLSDIGSLADRADSLRTGPDDAAIAWLGYDTPESVGTVLDDGRAAAAKDDLHRFQEGLRATHDGEPSHNTVVAHSYGTTVAGQAARDLGLAADDLILVASTDPAVLKADQYRLDVPPGEIHEHVHATVASDDLLAYEGANRYGVPPTADVFGARVFTTPSGSADPHSAAFERGIALDEIRRVINGLDG
jgi:hypothetical protein